jgi:S1-C subfamily serine protease
MFLKYGLKEQDQIIAVGRKEVGNRTALREAVLALEQQDWLEIVVKREEQVVTIILPATLVVQILHLVNK